MPSHSTDVVHLWTIFASQHASKARTGRMKALWLNVSEGVECHINQGTHVFKPSEDAPDEAASTTVLLG